MNIQKITNFLFDLFFPKKCIGCGKNGSYLCDSCFSKIDIASNNYCFICERPSINGILCPICRKKTNLDRLIWVNSYSNPLIENLIKAFKYKYVEELAIPLSKLLIKGLENNSGIPNVNNTIIVPIPLHKKRIRERGFNQAELLAKHVANYFSIPLENKLLKRVFYTTPQANLQNHIDRKENIKNAFGINPKFVEKYKNLATEKIKGKTAILIDDVATTGATLSEAAKILKKAGIREVWGLVIAKG